MRAYTCTSGLFINEVSIKYAEWLNTLPWGFYCTFSTRYSMSVKSARRAIERLHNHLQKKVCNVRLFWVAEPFDTKYSYHLHALLYFSTPTLKNAIELIKKAWQVISGGKGGQGYNNTFIEPYNKDLGANFYVSKYMMRHNSDYDIFF